MTMNTSAFNLEAVRQALRNAKEPCPWQRLMDLSYQEWRRPGRQDWCYQRMVEWTGETYGEVVKLFVLLGAAKYQICNGGLLQYFDNGYASEERVRFPRYDEDILLHKEMLALFGRYGLHQSQIGSEIYTLLAAFRIVVSDGSEDEEDDGCQRNEISNLDELDALDFRYYAVNEKWVRELKILAAKWLKTGSNPITDVGPLPKPDKPASRPRVKLVGQDGNAFAIIGRVCEALRKAGASPEIISQYRRESMSGDYNNVLETAIQYCEVY